MPSSAHGFYQLLFTDYGGFGFVLCLYLLLGILEVAFPADSTQRMSGRVTNIVATGLFLGLGTWVAKQLLHPLGLRPRHLPDGGILVSIAIVMAYGFGQDFGFYWYHRAQHKFNLLWPIHELHHTDTELNATTSLRSHWLEGPLQAALFGVPVICIVGFDSRAILLLPAIFTTWLFFAHANWRLSLGFLTPVICGPQVHRIHHSNLREHQNKNFAQFFPCIDMLFGTYYAPRREEFPTTGIEQRTSPASLAELTIGPFQSWTASLHGLLAKASEPPRRNSTRASARRPRPARRRRRA
jgi:sterol desaturase/sphingolipid hydroxylase (fatty acid hydroxylase superfamily)